MEVFDFVEMKIPAKAEYVGVIRLSVSGIASRMGFTFDTIEDLKVALSEAVTNVVTHAYGKMDEGGLTVGFSIFPDRLEMLVSDKGGSFQSEEVKKRVGPVETKYPISELREGGFGLFLINTLMDKVEINNQDGVTVQMTKYLDKAGVEFNDSISTKW